MYSPRSLMKKENMFLLPLLYPIMLTIKDLIVTGMEARTILPILNDIHSWTILSASILFASIYVLAKTNIIYKFGLGACFVIIGTQIYEVVWHSLYYMDFKYVIFNLSLTVAPLSVLFMYNLHYHFIKISFLTLGLFGLMIIIMVGLKVSGFFAPEKVWRYDTYRISSYGIPWAISKTLGYFMWLPLIRRT